MHRCWNLLKPTSLSCTRLCDAARDPVVEHSQEITVQVMSLSGMLWCLFDHARRIADRPANSASVATLMPTAVPMLGFCCRPGVGVEEAAVLGVGVMPMMVVLTLTPTVVVLGPLVSEVDNVVEMNEVFVIGNG